VQNSLCLELQALIPVGTLLIVSARFMRWMVRPATETDNPARLTRGPGGSGGKGVVG
jgi:hypothetical protein